MDPRAGVRTRRMGPADITGGVLLAQQAGWNQAESDWSMWLQLPYASAWIAEVGGRVIGSSAAIAYENRFGWVGMVLVDPAFRRRGVATQLVTRAVDYLEAAGCSCQKLDATESGRHLYSQHGFELECEVQRWVRPPGPSKHLEDDGTIQVLDGTNLTQVEGLDRLSFGADRLEVLRLLLSTRVRGYVCTNPSGSGKAQPRGYVAGRPGRQAVQLGPLVAGSPAAARLLVAAFLRDYGRCEIIADLDARNVEARILLQQNGFSLSRRLQRMFRGENRFAGKPGQVYCLAGFEWG